MKKRPVWLLAAALSCAFCVSALADSYTVSGWQELRDLIYGAPSGEVRTITLTQDVVCENPDHPYQASSISVGQGKNIILDLNGHKLDRGLYKGPGSESLKPHGEGSVIQIYPDGKLTVRDSSADKTTGIGKGQITGGYGNFKPGGVFVMTGATFILESGVIEGNRSANQYGGGVHIQRQFSTIIPGTFIMKGGLIQNNYADDNGGGVSVGGLFEMWGGTITANETESRGGGVWVDDSGLMFLGSEENKGQEITVKITGNKRIADNKEYDENIFLSEGTPLGVKTALSSECRIPVTSQEEPTAREPVLVTNVALSEEEAACFDSDHWQKFEIGRNEFGQIVLGVPLKLSFEAGAGSGSMKQQDVLGGVSFPLPACGFDAPAGKAFDSWLINDTEYEAQSEITLTADATAEAQYGDPVTITFKANDGSGSETTASEIAKQPILAGKPYTLPAFGDAFYAQPEGKAFLGWKIGEEADIRDPGYVIPAAGNVEITAQWEEGMTWTALREALSSAQSGSTIRLYNDIAWKNEEEDRPLVPAELTTGTITLDLNGHTLDRALERGRFGYVIEASNVHLIITDTSASKSGIITGGRHYQTEYQTEPGGGILVGDEGTVTFKGGSISGNQAVNGGGVMVKGTNAELSMEGGSIKRNLAEKKGGGVYISKGVMTITGGEIANNEAHDTAGAILAAAGAKLNLFGGTIQENSSPKCGSIWIDQGAEIFAQGAPEIFNSVQNEYACDIYLSSGTQIGITDVLYNNNPIEVLMEDGTGVFTGELNHLATPSNFIAAEQDYMIAATLDDKAVIGELIEVSFDPNGAAGSREPEQAVRGGVYILPDLERYTITDPITNKSNGISWPEYVSFNGWILPGEDEPRIPGTAVSFSDSVTLMVSWADNWSILQSRIDAGETLITLDRNICASRHHWGGNASVPTLTIPKGADVILDLAGFEIDRRTKTVDMYDGGTSIRVEGKLTIRDSSEDKTGRITSGSGKKGGAIYVAAGGELILEGGGIVENHAQWGGGVYVEKNAKFTMTGGFISENQCIPGGEEDYFWCGGAGVYSEGEFTMTGGTIAWNSSPVDGGGVCIYANGSVSISGESVITDNFAAHGGGVFVARDASFAMESGEISYNDTGDWDHGGGLYLEAGSTATMSGGTINGNCGGYGAGVYTEGSFVLSGGSITDNSANHLGGGIYANSDFTASGSARVVDNTLKGGISNVYLTNGKIIHIADAPFAGILSVTPQSAPTMEKPVVLTEGYGGKSGMDHMLTDDTERLLVDWNEKGEVVLCAPVILSFDAGPGTGSMDQIKVSGGMPFKLPDSSFTGPDGGKAFKEWLIDGDAYPAGELATLIANTTAVATYTDYTPGTPINTWDALAGALKDGGYVALEADISGIPASQSDVLADLIVTKDTTLDLAGHILTCKPDQPLVIQKEDKKPTLTILDSNPGSVHEDKDLPQGGILFGGIELKSNSLLTLAAGSILSDRTAGVKVGSFAEFTMLNGRIQPKGSTSPESIGVHVEQGTFTLLGGYILNFATGIRNENGQHTELSGGYIQQNNIGVENWKFGMLTLSGSEIEGPAGATGIKNYGSGVISMSAGSILGCGISVDNDGSEVEISGAGNLSGAVFTMSGGSVAEAGNILVHGKDAVFTLANGTITKISSSDPSSPAVVNVWDGGTFEMAGGEITDSAIPGVLTGAQGTFRMSGGFLENAFGPVTEGGPSESVHVVADGTFKMAGGEIRDGAETGVAVASGLFEMSGGRVSGKTGVTISGSGSVSGALLLYGGTVSGCSETGVIVSEKGEFVMVEGAVRDNAGTGISLAGGSLNVIGGEIAGNKLGVSVEDGSFTLYGGAVTGNTDTDVDVFAEKEGTSPRFGLAGDAETGNVRLAKEAVIHIDNVLSPDTEIVVVNAESGLGTVITEGLPLKGTVSRFDCKDDQYVVCLKDDGEAAVAYGVFFDTGDGTEVDPQYILANEQKAEKPEDPTLKNATFEDWYLEDSLYDFGTVITRSITLEAKWNYDVIGETDFTLPSSLSVIRVYAFGGLQGKTVMLPAVGDAQVVHVIRKDAFAGCKNMKVIIPGGWRIESGAFDGCTDMVLFGPVGGAADIYAAAHPDTCSFCPEN